MGGIDDRPAAQRALLGSGLRHFLQDDMRIHAAETKCVDSRAPRWVPRVVNPGPRVGIEVKRQFVQPRVGLFAVQAGRQDFIRQGHCRANERRHPGCWHQMADHRFDAAHCAALDRRFGVSIEPPHARQFSLVADDCPGSVGFEIPNCFRIDPSIVVGPLKSLDLPIGRWGQDVVPSPVAGDSDSFDDRIHLVSIAQGVLPAFEQDHSSSFADHDAIGPSIKRPNLSCRRYGPQPQEYGVHRRRMGQKQAADGSQVALPQPQSPDGLFGRQQRGRTCAINHVGQAAKIEAIGTQTGDDVRNRRRNGIRFGGGQGRSQIIVDLITPAVDKQSGIPPVDQLKHQVEKLGVHEDFREFLAGIPATTDDDVRSFTHRRIAANAGVSQRFIDQLDHHELVRIAVPDRVGNDAEFARFEEDILFQKRAARAVRLGVAIGEKPCPIDVAPTIFRHILNAVHAVDHIGPELVNVVGPWEPARHSDDGDVAVVHTLTKPPLVAIARGQAAITVSAGPAWASSA